MKAQHTPGRLKVGAPPPNGVQTIGTESGLMVAIATTGVDHPSKANARRLVACWNACDGLHTELLERNETLGGQIVDALNQRDELLAALKSVLNWIDDNCETSGFDAVEAQADAAIAKAERGTA